MADLPIEWLGPAARPRSPPPRWAVIALAVSVLLDVILGLFDVELSILGLAAAGSTIALASWAEDRLYLRSSRRTPGRQLLQTIAAVPAAIIGGIILIVLADGLGAEATSGAFFLGGIWLASAAGGTIVVLLIDAIGNRQTSRFATRIQRTVLGVVLVWGATAGAISLFIPRLIGRAFDDKPESFNVDIGQGKMSGLEFQKWLAASDLPEIMKALGPADLISAVFVLFALLLLLPAVISAAAKLGALAMERIHPIDQAMVRIAAGDLAVRVEEGGNLELRRLAVQFNVMVDALDMARRLEHAFGAYVSRPVLARIRAQHGALELPAISRDASVFFADVRGYTAISERLSPEQILALLRHYYSEALEIVAAHEGYVDKFIGDAIYVVFNGPIDQPDHVARSGRCALALIAKVAELNLAGAFNQVDRLEIGVGMATGPVVAGNLGTAHSTQFSVIGDTVNLAARLSGQAPAGEVWMSEASAQGLPPELSATPMPAIVVKGKAKPLVPYRLGLR